MVAVQFIGKGICTGFATRIARHGAHQDGNDQTGTDDSLILGRTDALGNDRKLLLAQLTAVDVEDCHFLMLFFERENF